MPVDFVTLAQQSNTAATFEAGVLERVGREVGFDVAFFLVKGDEVSATTLGLDEPTRGRATARGALYAQELLPVKRAALAARGVAVDTEVLTVAHVQKTRYFRELVSHVGGQHTLMSYVPWRGRTVAAMILGRGGKGFSTREVALVESLLPELGVTRAAYGLPQVFEPLPAPPATNLFQRVGLASRSRVLASVHTKSGTIVVRDRAGFREMVATDAASELVWTRVALTDPTRSGWPYVDFFHLAPALARQRRRALFVGCGGAVALRKFASNYPGIAIDVVEREPAVIDLARAWFDLDGIPGLAVHVAEGAQFIRAAAPGTWDIVVVDAYDASTFATEFSRTDFLATLRGALQPGGALACNVIGTLTGDGPVRSFASAARKVFDTVRVVPVLDLDESGYADSLRNVVVLATRGA